MSSEPTISVVIPTYQCGRFLRDSLDSILAQSGPDTEVIVVDDGSTDETPEILAAYGDALTVLRGQHGGLAAARNLGLGRARGRWIAFHDADDIAAGDRLAWSVAFLQQHPQFDAVFGNGQRMGVVDPVAASVVPRRWFERIRERPIDVTDLFEGYPVYFQGALVPRRAFDAAGAFDPDYRVQPDIDYGYRLFLQCRAACIDRPLFHYRWHTTNNSADLLGGREDIVRLLERLPRTVPEAARRIGQRRLRRRIAHVSFRLGLARLARGERPAARAAFRRAAALRPWHLRYQWMRARTVW